MSRCCLPHGNSHHIIMNFAPSTQWGEKIMRDGARKLWAAEEWLTSQCQSGTLYQWACSITLPTNKQAVRQTSTAHRSAAGKGILHHTHLCSRKLDLHTATITKRDIAYTMRYIIPYILAVDSETPYKERKSGRRSPLPQMLVVKLEDKTAPPQALAPTTTLQAASLLGEVGHKVCASVMYITHRQWCAVIQSAKICENNNLRRKMASELTGSWNRAISLQTRRSNDRAARRDVDVVFQLFDRRLALLLKMVLIFLLTFMQVTSHKSRLCLATGERESLHGQVPLILADFCQGSLLYLPFELPPHQNNGSRPSEGAVAAEAAKGIRKAEEIVLSRSEVCSEEGPNFHVYCVQGMYAYSERQIKSR